jgi:hypothetical protein
MLTVLLLRQELFWDTCIVGIIVYIAPNFYIAETIDYSPTQYWLSIVLIAAFMLLLCYTHWKVYYIRGQANDGKGFREPFYTAVIQIFTHLSQTKACLRLRNCGIT